ALDAEAVALDVLHARRVPDLDRARHRPGRIIGVRGVDLAVDHRGAVEMDGGALPLADEGAGLLIVFGDRAVVDGIERVGIDADALARFLDLEALEQLR